MVKGEGPNLTLPLTLNQTPSNKRYHNVVMYSSTLYIQRNIGLLGPAHALLKLPFTPETTQMQNTITPTHLSHPIALQLMYPTGLFHPSRFLRPLCTTMSPPSVRNSPLTPYEPFSAPLFLKGNGLVLPTVGLVHLPGHHHHHQPNIFVSV